MSTLVPILMLTLILIFFSFAFIHSITTSSWFKRACRDLLGDTFMRAHYRLKQ